MPPLANGRGTVYTGVMFGAMAFIAIFGVIVLAGTGFWIWMLIDCVTKEPDGGNTKVVWTLVIVLTHFIGAAIYLFVRRDRRIAEVGK